MTRYPTPNVPRGKRRRDIVAKIAYERATFELAYEGSRIESLTASWARRQAERLWPEAEGHRVGISDQMLPEIRRRTDAWKRDILAFEEPEDRERRERHAEQARETQARWDRLDAERAEA
jgi:hypothetical protein